MSNSHVLETQNNDKMRVLSLFSGIGAFEKAIKNLDIDYELLNYCEKDEHATLKFTMRVKTRIYGILLRQTSLT